MNRKSTHKLDIPRLDVYTDRMYKVTLRPPYIPLIQKPTCCAVTCLQMILFRNGLGLYDQEELAIEFGVKISADQAMAFSSAMPLMTRANFEEGVETIESQVRINGFFREREFPLKASAVRHGMISTLGEFLTANIQRNHDVWVEYHAQEIHVGDGRRGDYIHDGLVESVDLEQSMAVVIDPMPNHKQRLHIALPMLERSMSRHFGRETGFIVVENC